MIKKIFVAVAAFGLIFAGIVGQASRNHEFEIDYQALLSGSASIELLKEKVDNCIYRALDSEGNIVGFVTVTSGQGFNGNVYIAIPWTIDGVILDIKVLAHSDDLPWFNQLEKNGYYNAYITKLYTDPLELGDGVNAISGATYSSRGVNTAVLYARELVSEQLGNSIPIAQKPIQFGITELAVLLVFGTSLTLRYLPATRKKCWVRYASLTLGLFILGICLTMPLNLANFSTWLLGYGPDIHTHLSIYILLLTVLAFIIIFGKNIYCYWICPFAAIQEILHRVLKINLKPSAKYNPIFKMLRYVPFYLALFFTLWFYNPSYSTFEPWGTFFSLEGSLLNWLLLASVIVTSLFVYNPWCTYTCPVKIALNSILNIRKGTLKLWEIIWKRKMINPQVK
ncbi:4Fe-4S binding protein [Dehalococcoides sp. THU3]|uniref:4Fe-4S binding protein n=1 Tax=Dehalococcoides TaxID=61434 RepID=UPI0032188D6B